MRSTFADELCDLLQFVVAAEGDAAAGPVEPGVQTASPPKAAVRAVNANIASAEPLPLLLLRRVGHRDEGAESSGGARRAEPVSSQRCLPVSFDLLAETTPAERHTVSGLSTATVAQPHAVVGHQHQDGRIGGRARVNRRYAAGTADKANGGSDDEARRQAPAPTRSGHARILLPRHAKLGAITPALATGGVTASLELVVVGPRWPDGPLPRPRSKLPAGFGGYPGTG